MKKSLIILLVFVAIIGGIIWYSKYATPKVQTSEPVSTTNIQSNTPTINTTTSYPATLPGYNVYSNFDISFQYPAEWGIPTDSFSGGGFPSIGFSTSSGGEPLGIFIQPHIDSNSGSRLSNETFDQLIERLKSYNKYIYKVEDVTEDGVNGKELFDSDVSGQPSYVTAYFPLQNNSYISLSAGYQSVSQSVFDSIISTLKFSGTSASKIDSATGMFIYNNNGIRFEYPEKINTGYIGLNIVVSVKKADTTKLDSNGCYLPESNYGEKSATIVTINGIKFCSIVFSDVGAGQLGTDYGYVTFRDGNAYSIDYRVSSSNGCGAYQESNDLTAPENQRYNECLDAKKNYESLITKPIQNSISSFTFTN